MTAPESLRANRYGIWTTTLESLPAPEAMEAVAALDAAGWGSLWYGEAYGREAFTQAAMFLDAAPRMVVGTGIANIYGRGPMACAAAARNLEARFPGRFVLGLGVSHRPLVERDRGETYGPPLQAMRAYLERMAAAPYMAADATMPTVVVAALGPKMLELCAAETQGAHPYLVPPEHTAFAREHLGPDALLVVEQAVVVGVDAEEARRRAHEHLAFYTGLPNYRNNWLRLGFDESDFGRGGSERLAQALVAMGDVEAAVDRVHAHLDAGADHVLVQAVGATMGEVPTGQWSLLADALLR
ncbi:MAG TPA: TIGR03620 family F420-dependent LLM class oxidoreductase [Acidimicrobiales bacterium]|nr:TIGR03620 family F420-dependent LLM class oxidoreductase [Acidimicrobiales bacterium]